LTALDTNVLIALWDHDPAVHRPVRQSLDRELRRGGLVVSAPVFAELRAGPGRSDAFLDTFCADTGIEVDWGFPEAVWRSAGEAFQRQVASRASGRPRRLLADCLIGAHAAHRCGRLLTLDPDGFRRAFPALELPPVED